MPELYQAVFRGEVLEGADPEEVRAQLEELGVLSTGASRDAFAGKPVVLRDELTLEQARKFAGALEAVRARCHVLSARWLACPACGLPQEPGVECLKCGLIFAKQHNRDLPPVRTRREIAQDLKSAGYKRFESNAG